ncbi:hypothetical protein A9Q91_03310 [Candidatus Gracilibacteria bacterium 28_42_T64]|nr:hypothetical protein A9Q91_03310 [Candidatus Gracilibacteria bacterium 28_42_T64]
MTVDKSELNIVNKQGDNTLSNKVSTTSAEMKDKISFILELVKNMKPVKIISSGRLYNLNLSGNMYQLEVQKSIGDILETSEFFSIFQIDKDKAERVFIDKSKNELCILYKD